MLRIICEQLGILEHHIEILENIESNLQYVADLVMADVFIDCFQEDDTKAVVVGQARPSNGYSLFDRIIVGENVLPEKEPAVFAAKMSGMSIRDIRATTLDGRIVKQNIVPIMDDNVVIGVLICEYDISQDVLRDRKYKQMAETMEHLSNSSMVTNGGDIQQKEIHHRVKNNLQMVASILNIQARKVESEELKLTLKENVNRILSIATIHDLLTYQREEKNLSVHKIVEKVVSNIMVYAESVEKKVEVRVRGDDALVNSDRAVSIAVIINELVTNALKHAFVDCREGLIEIQVGRGNSYVFITVMDNGSGFLNGIPEEGHFGLGLVKTMVTDKLQGNLQIHSGTTGTQITFDFENSI